MLFGQVDVGLPGSFGLVRVVILGVQSTKGDIRRKNSLRTVDLEEGGITGGLASLRAQSPHYSG